VLVPYSGLTVAIQIIHECVLSLPESLTILTTKFTVDIFGVQIVFSDWTFPTLAVVFITWGVGFLGLAA
jgi:hypothetical protein